MCNPFIREPKEAWQCNFLTTKSYFNVMTKNKKSVSKPANFLRYIFFKLYLNKSSIKVLSGDDVISLSDSYLSYLYFVEILDIWYIFSALVSGVHTLLFSLNFKSIDSNKVNSITKSDILFELLSETKLFQMEKHCVQMHCRADNG